MNELVVSELSAPLHVDIVPSILCCNVNRTVIPYFPGADLSRGRVQEEKVSPQSRSHVVVSYYRLHTSCSNAAS
jgi:hypothetical protein